MAGRTAPGDETTAEGDAAFAEHGIVVDRFTSTFTTAAVRRHRHTPSVEHPASAVGRSCSNVR